MRLAVLIDADNASATVIGEILAMVASYGTATVKRIYGDFTTPNLANWSAVLHKHAIQPVQQFPNTPGKNASDSALIIDAMDLLYARKFEGFCIVSSDSDFTRLATRIREDGLAVYGFGKKQTPKSFIHACDDFVHIEKLQAKAIIPAKAAAPAKPAPSPDVSLDEEFKDKLRQSIDAVTSKSGRATLAEVGAELRKRKPGFVLRNYGVSKLVDLVTQMPDLKVSRGEPKGGSQVVYVEREK